MRFALIATTAAAVVAVPFALGAAGPQMTSDEFLTAVRCAAYEDAAGGSAAEAKYRLNAEGNRHSAETIAAAEAEVSAIARQAVNSQTAQDQAKLRSQRAQACSEAAIAFGGERTNAV
jgi:hypothetical protein